MLSVQTTETKKEDDRTVVRRNTVCFMDYYFLDKIKFRFIWLNTGLSKYC